MAHLRQVTLVIIMALLGAALLSILGFFAYQEYWYRSAKGSVLLVADGISAGNLPPTLQLSDSCDPAHLTSGFATGYDVSRVDVIGFGFRAYEIDLRVGNGDIYKFDAYYDRDGTWLLHCDCAPRTGSQDL